MTSPTRPSFTPGTGENAPMPYAKNLEQLKTPSRAKIAAAIRQVCNR